MCRVDKGYVRDENGNCVCPLGTAVDIYGDCKLCEVARGYRIDEAGRCVCALERGWVIDERGRCVCPIEHGFKVTPLGECVMDRIPPPQCQSDDECADDMYCDKETKNCALACIPKVCGVNALCNATNHVANCVCITGYTGNPEVLCSKYLKWNS